jgi:hypothetical protein
MRREECERAVEITRDVIARLRCICTLSGHQSRTGGPVTWHRRISVGLVKDGELVGWRVSLACGRTDFCDGLSGMHREECERAVEITRDVIACLRCIYTLSGHQSRTGGPVTWHRRISVGRVKDGERIESEMTCARVCWRRWRRSWGWEWRPVP